MFDNFDLLFVNEAAVMLRVSGMTIYKLIHNGEIDAFKIGKTWKINKVSLLNYIKRHKKQ